MEFFELIAVVLITLGFMAFCLGALWLGIEKQARRSAGKGGFPRSRKS